MRHDAIMRRCLIIALLSVSACGSPSVDTVEGVSANEAQALNDAAKMLDDNAVVPVPVENVANVQ
jgi:hypothetical protein